MRQHIVHICSEHSVVCEKLGTLLESRSKFVSYKWLIGTFITIVGGIIAVAFSLHSIGADAIKASETKMVEKLENKADKYKVEWMLSDISEIKKSVETMEKNQVKYMMQMGVKPVKE